MSHYLQYTAKFNHLQWNIKQLSRRTHENFLFILLCSDINFEKIPF